MKWILLVVSLAVVSVQGGKEFVYVTDERVYWDDAYRACRDKGMHLASIRDLNEDQQIQKKFIEQTDSPLNYCFSKTLFWVGGVIYKEGPVWASPPYGEMLYKPIESFTGTDFSAKHYLAVVLCNGIGRLKLNKWIYNTDYSKRFYYICERKN